MARYYDPARGQFVSQDRSFLSIGDPNQVKKITGQDQQMFLADPQVANSYNYARGNPITMKDPNGDFLAAAVPFAIATAPQWAPWVGAALVGTGAAIIYNASDISLRANSGQRFVPFYKQGREVQLPGVPDPIDPWNRGEWKPGNPKDWKTWLDIGLGIIGTAGELYEAAKHLPTQPPATFSSPGTVTQQGNTYYRNSSGMLSTAPNSKPNPSMTSGGSSGSGILPRYPTGPNKDGVPSYCSGVCAK